MPNIAYVITDGSHDATFKVGGVAGKIVIHGEKGVTEFQKNIFNAFDSTVVEFIAIKEALDMLAQKKKQGIKLDHVVFATDSLDLICATDPDQIREKFPEAIPYINKAKKYQNMTSKLTEKAKEIGVSFELMKVKAHVPDHEASELERIHNQVDLMAKIPKDRVVESIDMRRLKKGKSFTVMIPKEMSPEKFEQVKNASFKLIRQGYSPRVLIQSGAQNPVSSAYAMYESSMGSDVANAARKSMRVFRANEQDSDASKTISGLNRARARQWIVEEGCYPDEWELNGFQGALMNDIVSSTLGNAYPINVISKQGYKGSFTAKASEFILHHGEEKLMPEHLEMMNRAVKVYALERILTSNVRFETPKSQVDMALSEIGY